jgi:pilus assembly protein CpaF
MLAGENIGARFVVPTVAACVDLVVYLEIGSEGRRLAREIEGVPGRVEADVIETGACVHRTRRRHVFSSRRL